MRKKLLPRLLLWVCLPTMVFTACVDDSELNVPAPLPNSSFVEQFDTFSNAYARGWRTRNRSFPLGGGEWRQPFNGADYFPAYSSRARNNGFAIGFADACRGTIPEGNGVISNWLVAPPTLMKNGDRIIFYTRDSVPDFVDRMQVRLNPVNDGANIPSGTGFEVGDFTYNLLDINPTLSATGINAYPGTWTRFETIVRGLPKPGMYRFAFRHFVPGGGPGATELGGIVVGIDSVAFVSK
jgi:hypothetical protein